MSRILENYSFVGKGRSASYDWDTLLDGRIHECVQGEDFDCKPESFRNGARTAATARGLTLRTAVIDNTVVIQASQAVTTNA